METLQNDCSFFFLPMSAELKEVELCPVCGLPPEYCEFGSKFDLCKPWLKENHLDLYPDLAELEVTDEMTAATLEAINARETVGGLFCLRFGLSISS